MRRFTNYVDLDVWKEARKLANQMYSTTKLFPSDDANGLGIIIRKVAIAVPSSVAEATGLQNPNDTLEVLFRGRGLLYELESCLYLAFDQSYISEDELNQHIEQLTICKRLINGFINYYRKAKQNRSGRRMDDDRPDYRQHESNPSADNNSVDEEFNNL